MVNQQAGGSPAAAEQADKAPSAAEVAHFWENAPEDIKQDMGFSQQELDSFKAVRDTFKATEQKHVAAIAAATQQM